MFKNKKIVNFKTLISEIIILNLKFPKIWCSVNSIDRDRIGNKFAMHAEYNGVAEINEIIILYPQVKSEPLRNPRGCWDWSVDLLLLFLSNDFHSLPYLGLVTQMKITVS